MEIKCNKLDLFHLYAFHFVTDFCAHRFFATAVTPVKTKRYHSYSTYGEQIVWSYHQGKTFSQCSNHCPL